MWELDQVQLNKLVLEYYYHHYYYVGAHTR